MIPRHLYPSVAPALAPAQNHNCILASFLMSSPRGDFTRISGCANGDVRFVTDVGDVGEPDATNHVVPPLLAPPENFCQISGRRLNIYMLI